MGCVGVFIWGGGGGGRGPAWRAVRFENPPTKKKMGITWNTQVPSHIHDVTPTALVVLMTPSCHQMMPMNQWPKTTVTMLAALRKSTTRSRVSGVADAIWSRVVGAIAP